MKSLSIVDRRGFFKSLGVASMASVGVLMVTPSTAGAATDVSHKIKIAGDLRTFTQRMAMASAFVMLDVEREHFLEVLREECDEFSEDIESLRNGDPEYSMEPEENKLVLEALHTVEIGWSILGPQIKEVLEAGSIDEAHFNKIEHINVQVMTLADSLIHRILFEYSEDIPTELAYQIDVVGTLRTFSQKMIKEAVLTGLGFEAEAHHEMMEGSMLVFQFGLDKLNGQMLHNEIMLPAAEGEIKAQLVQIEELWAILKPQLEAMDAAASIDAANIVELSHEADSILSFLDEISAVLIKRADAV